MKVSRATEKNWKRLNSDVEKKLRKGANKSASEKRFIPVEYLNCGTSSEAIRKIVSICRKENTAVSDAIFTVGVLMLKRSGILHRRSVQEFLLKFKYDFVPCLSEADIPEHERDFPGALYQSLLTEGEKNSSGSYYTPEEIVRSMTGEVDLSDGRSFLDPCCGSGSFFLELDCDDPRRIWGCDRDEIAVFIAGVNLLIKFKEHDFVPNVFCADYLEGEFPHTGFDYIVTNPPWGEKNRSKESSTQFFLESFKYLKDKGSAVFLFPESVLSVKQHSEFRRKLLTQCRIRNIARCDIKFSGVMSRFSVVSAVKDIPEDYFTLEINGEKHKISVSQILNDKNNTIKYISNIDNEILEQISKNKKHDLSSSIFALGIVTGDNKNKIKKSQFSGSVEVYSGKQLSRYFITETSAYFVYDPSNFQQCAPEEYYFSEEKLVYKFISGKPVFAYDNKKRLFLNSANILIPKIPEMGIKTVLAFLDSELMTYFYRLKFSDIKVLKSNLCELPFPEISAEDDAELTRLVDLLLAGDLSKDSEIQDIIFRCFGLTDEQKKRVKSENISTC